MILLGSLVVVFAVGIFPLVIVVFVFDRALVYYARKLQCNAWPDSICNKNAAPSCRISAIMAAASCVHLCMCVCVSICKSATNCAERFNSFRCMEICCMQHIACVLLYGCMCNSVGFYTLRAWMGNFINHKFCIKLPSDDTH